MGLCKPGDSVHRWDEDRGQREPVQLCVEEEHREEAHKAESADGEGITRAGSKPWGQVAHPGGPSDPSHEEATEEAVCQSGSRAAFMGNGKRAS